MTNIIQITPFMHVRDLEGALEFLCGTLGFETHFQMPGYAYVEREGAGLRILESPDAILFPPDCGRYAYYLDVRDVDSLHAELKPKLDALPEADVHGPADKHYGQRELLVRAPDGQLFAFGQAIRCREGS